MLAKEIVYACLDLAKAATSDDSFLNEEHCLFLCKKYRSFLVKKERDREKEMDTPASDFEYQEICLNLEPISQVKSDPCENGDYLWSIEELPKIMEGTAIKIYPTDYFSGSHITMVSKDRMKYVGSNSYLQNVIFASLGPDFHIYLKSSNPQFLHLKKVRVSAIFEDFEDAVKYACDKDGKETPCDVLDAPFPIRDYLVPTLIDMVVKELVGAAYRPADSSNDAADNLAELVNFIRRNTKSALQKQIED